MERVSLEQIVYSNFVRYDVLEKLINSHYGSLEYYKSINHLNIFIDMYSIVRRLYGDVFDVPDPNILTSLIVNMCGHYRNFFRNKYATDTTIYIVDSNNCCNLNRKFYQGYNQGYAESVTLNEKVTKLIYHNRQLLGELCSYLPNIEYIATDYETGVMIKHIITTNRISGDNTSPNMIISKDIYLYQLVSDYIKDDVCILRPKKYKGEDSSFIVNPYNVMYYYTKDRSTSEDTILTASNKINYGLLSYLMCITRLPERGIKSIVSIPKIVKLLSKLIDQNIIINGKNTDINRLSSLLFMEEENQIPAVTIDFRFKAIDIDFQYSVFIDSVDARRYNGTLTNLYDPVSVREINEKHFSSCPIILENL